MNENDLISEQLYNSIEDVLQNQIVKRKPVDQLMAQVRFRYPNPVFFIESSEFMLRNLGLTNSEAFYFWMIPGLARIMNRDSFGKKPRLNTLSQMEPYLRSLYIGVHVERFYAVLLDSRGWHVRTMKLGEGTVDSAPFDMCKLMSLLMDYSAKAVVLCHNHPGGTLVPSQEDIKCTLSALSAMTTIGVPLLDHIIISCERTLSIRDSGYISPELWVMQGPDKKLVREWLGSNAPC